MSHQTIAPGLLLAMPQLMDPFYRAVVLMIEHNDSGSLGVVVNRPVETRLSTVMDHLEIGWKGDPDALVFCGGPVQQEMGWLLHEPVSGADGEGTLGLTPGLAVLHLGRNARPAGPASPLNESASCWATPAGGRDSSRASSRRAPGYSRMSQRT